MTNSKILGMLYWLRMTQIKENFKGEEETINPNGWNNQ